MKGEFLKKENCWRTFSLTAGGGPIPGGRQIITAKRQRFFFASTEAMRRFQN